MPGQSLGPDPVRLDGGVSPLSGRGIGYLQRALGSPARSRRRHHLLEQALPACSVEPDPSCAAATSGVRLRSKAPAIARVTCARPSVADCTREVFELVHERSHLWVGGRWFGPAVCYHTVVHERCCVRRQRAGSTTSRAVNQATVHDREARRVFVDCCLRVFELVPERSHLWVGSRGITVATGRCEQCCDDSGGSERGDSDQRRARAAGGHLGSAGERARHARCADISQ